MQGLREVRERKYADALAEASKFSQSTVASAIGVTPPTYRKIERDPRRASDETLEKLAEYLDCTVDAFYLSSDRK